MFLIFVIFSCFYNTSEKKLETVVPSKLTIGGPVKYEGPASGSAEAARDRDGDDDPLGSQVAGLGRGEASAAVMARLCHATAL